MLLAGSLLAAVASLLTLPAQAQDGSVSASDLKHDSRGPAYRYPTGPVATGTKVTLRLRTAAGDLSEARLLVTDVRTGQTTAYAMTPEARGVDDGSGTQVDFWAASIPALSSPTALTYRFVAEDGSDRRYVEDDAARDGGTGEATTSSPGRPWQISVYDDLFDTPSSVRNDIFYRIDVDRFRNGDAGNDPGAGEFFYGDFDTIVRSNDGQNAWKARVCDPIGLAGSTSTCLGAEGANFYGGDLQGVIDELDALDAKGITALSLSPIFRAPSSHGTDPTNYFKVDPRLGDLSTLQGLISATGMRGIDVHLDGPFHHVSSDSYYFDRYDRWNGDAPSPSDAAGTPVLPGTSNPSGACETTDASETPYLNWFAFSTYTGPGTAPCSDGRDAKTIARRTLDLPVLQHDQAAVRDVLFRQGTNSAAPFWISQGVEGWRLLDGALVDGGTTGEPSNDFWEGFRTAVRAQNPDAFIAGDVREDPTSWTLGDEWDSATRYDVTRTLIGFWRDTPMSTEIYNDASALGRIEPTSPTELMQRLQSVIETTPPQALEAALIPLGTDRTNRSLVLLDPGTASQSTALYNDPSYDWSEAITRLRGAALLQMTLFGAPVIHQGDEVGAVHPPAYDGARWQSTPYSRVPYPWSDESGTPYYSHVPDRSLETYYETLLSAHGSSPSLQHGDFEPLASDDGTGVIAYGRKTDGDTDVSVVAVNRSASAQSVSVDVAGYLPAGASLSDALSSTTASVDASGTLTVSVPARGGLLLRGSDFSGQRPGCVTDLSASSQTGQVDLSWNSTSNATAYRVLRSRLSGGGFSEVASPSGTSYSDTGVDDGTTYYYTVVSKNTATLLESGRCGNEVAATPKLSIVFANLQFPPALSHVVSAVDSTSAVFGQLYIAGATDVQSTAVEGVTAQVGYGPAGTLPSSADWTWFDMRPNPGYDFTTNNDEYVGKMLPLRSGTFKFTTRWSTDGGATWTYTDQFGPPYDEVDAGDLTTTRSSDTVPPSPPTDLTVQSTSRLGITLEWTASPNLDTDVAGYHVERKLASESGFTRITEVNDVTGASTTTYTDDTVSPGETYDYRVVAYDVALNESTETSSVRAIAKRRMVDITFRVTVPSETPGAFPVYLTGTFQDAPFTHGEVAWQLSETDPTTWEATFSLADGQTYEYRYTRGAETRVETEADGNTPIGTRTVTAAYGTDGTQLVEDTVAGWRDPFVTSLSPPDGATGLIGVDVTVDLTWDEAMPPEPAGFTLTGSSGKVSGTWSYDASSFTHTFTPDAPLGVDTYTVEQRSALDAGGDVQEVDTVTTFSVGAIPVKLAGLSAALDGETVVVTWQTSAETNNDGFTVQRTTPQTGDFESIGHVDGAGTTDAAQAYRFVDPNPPFLAETLTYRLKQVDADGSVEYSRPETVRRGPPDELRLHGSFPNPATTTATVRYELPKSGSVRITLYDVLGRRVATLVDEEIEVGRHRHTFSVSRLASGAYFLRIDAEGTTRNQPLKVVR